MIVTAAAAVAWLSELWMPDAAASDSSALSTLLLASAGAGASARVDPPIPSTRLAQYSRSATKRSDAR
ncbi:hypothetical protein MLGJGCBP_04372 [Rhodococcus sp. T7]|nr:hypothetical protein MLGJGCBP_04372 [Rhodococcus sp. T7]